MDPCAFTFPINKMVIAFCTAISHFPQLHYWPTYYCTYNHAVGDTAFVHLADCTIADMHYSIRKLCTY